VGELRVRTRAASLAQPRSAPSTAGYQGFILRMAASSLGSVSLGNLLFSLSPGPLGTS
jgi:hypothetical protein